MPAGLRRSPTPRGDQRSAAGECGSTDRAHEVRRCDSGVWAATGLPQAPERGVDRAPGADCAGRHQVGVGPKRQPGVVVAEVLGQRLGVLARVQEHRGVKVPERVRAVLPGGPFDPRFRPGRPPRSLVEVLPPHRPTEQLALPEIAAGPEHHEDLERSFIACRTASTRARVQGMASTGRPFGRTTVRAWQVFSRMNLSSTAAPRIEDTCAKPA